MLIIANKVLNFQAPGLCNLQAPIHPIFKHSLHPQ